MASSTSTKYVFITGAGSGIGQAIAKKYAHQGHHLILGGRNREKLDLVAEECTNLGADTTTLEIDLSDTETIKSRVEYLKSVIPHIDILVNNAGLSQRSKIVDTELSTHRKIFEVNYFGTIELTNHILDWMISEGKGTIAVISSIAGKFGFPMRSSYSASKHALMGYFGTLDLECKDAGITVCMVCPGRIKTPISLNALRGDGSTKQTMDRGLMNGMDVDVCAGRIVRSIRKGKYISYVGGKELLMVPIFKFFPSLFRRIARGIDPE